jgi:uncharacterized protein YbbK (DUF523 family)
MLLAHHRAQLDNLREPTATAPWRVLISGCLAAWQCGVDGTDYGLGVTLSEFLNLPTFRALPFCPEQHSLGTPRLTPDIQWRRRCGRHCRPGQSPGRTRSRPHA